MSRRNRSAVDILEDHERAIKRLQAALSRAGGGVSGAAGYRETVIFTSSGTFTKADYPWLTHIRVTVVAGGGAGGGAPATGASEFSIGAGGGGGGAAITDVEVASLGTTETVTVGAGGTAVNGAAGNDGNDTSFGAHAIGKKGEGGNTGGPQVRGIVLFIWGGYASAAGTGDIVIRGGAGGTAIADERYGTTQRAGDGGASHLAGNQNPESQTGGLAGLPYGGGGSGGARSSSVGAVPGGAGAAGVVIIELFDKSGTGSPPFDHGTDLVGQADDDHPQYLLADGTRDMTGAGNDFGLSIIGTDEAGAWGLAELILKDSVTGDLWSIGHRGTASGTLGDLAIYHYDDSGNSWRQFLRFDISADQVLGRDGTAALPGRSYISNPTSGMFLISANTLGFAVNGVEEMRINGSGLFMGVAATGAPHLRGSVGTVGNPGFSFAGDLTMGMYRQSSGILAFATSGTKRASVLSYGLSVENKVIVRGSVLAHDPDTSGSAATAVYAGTSIGEGVGRRLVRSTASSRAYKRNIQRLVKPPVVHAVTFNYNPGYVGDDMDGEVLHYGFIAEEVREALGDDSATFNEDGTVDDYNWKHVIATLEARLHIVEDALRSRDKQGEVGRPE